MKVIYSASLTLLAGFVLGAISMHALHAQSKPPAYVIDQIDVSNLDAYVKEFGPLAGKAIEAGGGKYLARGGKTVVIEGEPPKGRVVVLAFDSLEQAQAAFSSPAMLEARKIGDKYATFRTFAVEALPK
jgi:uncharacterized protein (DUF1330 family)